MIKKWKKSGPEITLLQKFGKSATTQVFIDPRDGKKHEFFFLYEQNSVGIVALTKKREVVLVRQFKQAANRIVLEIPAGVIDEDESPLSTAKRELKEETGYGPKKIKQIGRFMRSTRNIPSDSYCFLATGCEKLKNAKLDKEEDLEVVLKPWTEWVAEVKSGTVLDPLSIIATLLAQDHLNE